MKITMITGNGAITIAPSNGSNYKVVIKDYSNHTVCGIVGTPEQCADFIARKTGETVILA